VATLAPVVVMSETDVRKAIEEQKASKQSNTPSVHSTGRELIEENQLSRGSKNDLETVSSEQ
jgi:hypothetical protein